MACELKTEAYIPIVKNLFKLDSEKYKNFDNVVEFIAKSAIKPENKKLAIHNIAHIYKNLNGLAPEMYELGKASDVIAVVTDYDDTNVYLKRITDLYGLPTFKPASLASIEKMLEDLGNKKGILTSDIDDYMNLVSQHVASTKYDSIEQRSETLQHYKDKFYEIISALSLDENIKSMYQKMLDGRFDKLAINSNYVPLNSVQELAELDNYLFTMKDGRMTEGFIEGENYYIPDPTNNSTRIQVNKEDVVAHKRSRPSDVNYNNTGKHVFFPDFFNSGFTIDSVTPEEYEDLMKELNSLENPSGQIEVFAVQLTNAGDNRVDRMHQLAFADEQYAHLRNRNHETFESTSQQELLKSKADAKVVTVSRPKRSDAEFALVGQIKGTNRKFYIYSLENFAFVNADNKTELVDFENDTHLKDFQKLAVKQQESDQVELTEADINFIKSSHKSFQDFKNEVAAELANAISNSENSVNVTDKFLQRYNVQATRPTADKATILSKAILENPQYSKEVTIATMDENGNITSEETRRIPFVYYMDIDTKQKTIKYVLTPYLASNERIKVETEGRTSYVSEYVYADDVLGLNKKVPEMFKKQNEKIQNALNNNLSVKRINKIGRFVVKFGDNNSTSFAIAKTKHQLESNEYFANFATEFFDAINSEDVEQGIKKFSQSFQFKALGTVLSFNLSASVPREQEGKKLKERNPQIEIRPYTKNDRYKNAIMETPEQKRLFNFELNKQRVNSIISKFISASLNNRIIKENPSLASFDLKKADDRINFYKTIFEILDTADASPAVKEFINNFKQGQKELTNYIIEKVDSQLNLPNEELQAKYKEFKELVKQDKNFNSIEEVTAANLFALKDEEGNLILNMESPRLSNARYLFNRSYKNAAVITNESRKRFYISSKGTVTKEQANPVTVSPAEQAIVDEVKAEETTPDFTSFDDAVAAVEQTPSITEAETTTEETTDEFDDDEGDEITPFQLLGDDYERASTQDLETEAAWLTNALPQIGISKQDVSDVINMTKINGTVLGLFMNKMIHLNSQMTSKGITYHEAFHGVFRHLMTQTERDNLIKAVMDDASHAAKFTPDAVYQFGRDRNYTENDYDTLARLVAEEILADGFQRYMLKKNPGQPKTFLQRFFDMLKKLLQFFVKNKNIIEHTYSKINNGGYASSVYQSNIYDGKAAFELIPVQTVRTKTPDGKKVFSKNVTLNTYEQSQLINLINAQIFSDNMENETFDVKFQKAVDALLENVISVEKLVAQNPSKKDAILNSDWAKLFSKYRFVLGARMKNLPVYDINLTGDAADDKLKTKLTVTTSEGTIDNSKGEHSFAVLKKLSKQSYDKANAIDIVKEEEQDIVDSEELESVISGEKQNTYTDEDTASVQDELDGNNFDDAYGQANPIDSYVRQVRRYFATIRNDFEDTTLGIKIPRVIDGNMMFPAMLKISANLQPGSIIQTLGVMADKMMDDGYVQEGSDMKAIYDDIVLSTGIDKSTGRPTKNHQLYNVITDALHGVELNYLFFTHRTPEKITEDTPAQEVIQLQNKQLEFGLYDKVSDTDNSNKRDKIIIDFIKAFKEKANDPEYKEAIKTLTTLIEMISLQPDFLNRMKSQSVVLKEITEDFDKALKAIGFKIPKSLVQLSLATIFIDENKQFNKLDEQDNLFLSLNKNFTNQGQYLELDFFKSFREILRDAYTTEGKVNRNFAKRLDDKTKNLDDKRFLLILKKASAYISKYDPTSLPSVIKNAEGKSIYRYAKINPLQTLAQRLNTMTLDEAISNDPYYKQVHAYMLDNPFLAPLLKDPESEEARYAKLYMDNFNVAMFGGIQQQVGKFTKDGKSFKGIDKRSMYTLQLLTFLNRRVVSDKYGNEMALFYRSFHQLESTQTNFLVPAIYTPFVNKDGKARENGKDKIVTTLMNAIKQEYNRINREWSSRVDRKQKFENGESNDNITKYNATLNDDGKTIDVESDNLRAYNFNVLEDFFSDPANQELKEQLIGLAKRENEDKVNFEDITIENELKDALQIYADKEFQKFKQDLIDEELIELKDIPKNRQETNPVDKRKVVPTTYYSSNLLPKFVKTDVSKNSKSNLSSIYPDLPGFDHTQSHEEIVPLDYMLYDYFMNHWKNALETNQLMDGDIAMNVKNFQDYVKRLKKIVASGSNFKEGFHTAAYINTITAFVHEKYPYNGPYLNEEQIQNDFTITNDAVRNELIAGFRKAQKGVKETVDGVTTKWGDMMREIFDGQSISTLMHQMDMHDSIGRVDDRVIDILIAKHYRALTESEKNYLSAKKVVNNAKKTVTAGRNTYHKNSEDYTDRLDVSRLIVEPLEGESVQDATNRVFDELHAAYSKVYALRRASHYLSLQDPNHIEIEQNKAAIQDIFKNTIHQYYEPLPHRKVLHNILNSMEFHQVDQLMDTTASKNATKIPVDIFNYERDENDYIRFDMSSSQVPNEDKYLQVETSGVKEKAKHSVQSKLLLPADLSTEVFRKIIQEENARRGTMMTESEENAMLKINDELKKYQISLGKAGKARLDYFKNVLRKGGDFQVGMIYKMIRKSLEEQNAPTNTLKYFDLKPDGTPLFSPNLSVIRTTLEYYLLSQYSNNVTDEKTSGGKNFHISGFGHDVMVDTVTNQVITTEEVSLNPELYSDETRYKSRPLSVSVEIQPDGSKLYFAEVIMPKPYFENKQQEQFYMDNLTKMFGVRIPTEDKRSMLAFKVVDFVDSSKLNNIIVPQFVHMLSGSDFDIDSLFFRMKSYYKNSKNDYVMFGQYDQYKTENAGKFIEFIHFMKKHDDFALAIKAEKQRLIDQNTFELSDESPVFEILNAMNYNLGTDVLEFFDRKEIKSKLKDAKEFTSYMFDLAKDAKELYIQTKLEAETDPTNKDLAKERNQYGYEYATIRSIKGKSLEEKRALRERLTIVDAAFEYKASLNVLSEFGMPASVEAFNADPIYNNMVSMRHQNDNLDASIGILANEAVFNYLYINQRSSVEQFKNILGKFELSLETLTKKGNLYTPTNMVLSKVENSMNKDGIGRTAVMNKFLSLASQYKLRLNDEQQIWKFINEKGEEKSYAEFGQLNDDNQRVISVIGNILGMFADAAKEPIPAALQLNEVNISTTLAMLGIGLKPEFAFGFNFLPGVRNASKAVQQAQFAISEDAEQEYVFYNNAVLDEIKKEFNSSTLMSDLINLGVMKYGSSNIRPILEKGNIKIEFEPQSLKGKDLNRLSASDIGFKISTKKGVELTDAQAEMVLMIYYWEQAQQAWPINRVAGMTNLFKRLNPSLAAFDKHRENIKKIQSAELFTKESVGKLFEKENAIFKILSDALDDANEQFSKILLERSEFFSSVSAMYAKYFKEPKLFSNVITSYLGISKFVNTYPGSRSVENEYMQDIIDEDDRLLRQTFTPEYWFTNSLAKELEKLQNKYPKNEFLKLLKPEESDKTATVEYNGKDYKSNERFLQVMSRAKIKGEFANTIVDSIAALYNTENAEERLFVKKLFYHELVRTGMLPKAGSFFQFMPAELVLPISNNIEEFINYMKNATKQDKENFPQFIGKYLGTEDETQVYKFFDELFNQIAYAAATEKGNDKIPTFKYYGNKVDYTTEIKNNPNFSGTNINMFNFLEESAKNSPKKEDMVKAKIKMINHFFAMFGAKPDPSIELEYINKIPLTRLLEKEFTMDLSQDLDKPAISLSKPFGVKYNKDAELFEFPSLMKVNGVVYVLQSTDGASTEGISSGESLVKDFTGKSNYTNFGIRATYKAIPEIYSSEKFSPLAFTAEQAENYKDYIDQKKKIIHKPSATALSVKSVNIDKLETTDKIIWGHPGLGKTTFKEKNSDKVLDFDTDFKPIIAKKLGLPVEEQNSIGLNKWRKENGDEEFNKLMRSTWATAKDIAKKENKILVVSDMIFLRENASDFDKVITTSKETFVKRATERGDNIENLKSWKEKIDATISSMNQSKVVTTDKYFSELIPTQPTVVKTEIKQENTPTEAPITAPSDNAGEQFNTNFLADDSLFDWMKKDNDSENPLEC